MLRKIVFILLLILTTKIVFSQMGGSSTYEFLNLPSNTRIATMGGNNVSNYDNDLNFSLTNPALLRHTMDKQVSLNYINYVSDINLGYVTYAHNIKDVGTFAAGLHYINYGDFLHTNETGEILGNFVPSEYSLNLYYSRPLNSKFNAGAALKTIYSSFFTHFSSGVALDLGLSYFDSDHLFSAGLVVKNFGTQLKPYTTDNYEPLPFDIQLGFTKGLAHAPLRFSVTFQNLLNWNLSYKSVFESSNMLGEEEIEEDKLINKVEDYADELMRHVVLGFEIVPGDSFFISLGYNYRRRSELSLSTMPKLVGMSIGAGLRLEKFNFSYGIASYHLAGNSNHITLGLNLGAFYKKLN
jgi:hypothetical protein